MLFATQYNFNERHVEQKIWVSGALCFKRKI